METNQFKWFSPNLGRDMECKVWGHAGHPVLFIPCQDVRYFDFENFKMTDVWGPWIESGQVMVLGIDTIDLETWSNKDGDGRWKAERHEAWIRYITDEVVPHLRNLANEKNGWEGYPGIITFGCSLGATHAANLYLRRPDLFDGTLALSGIYTSEYGFGSYMDDIVYQNSPVHYMRNLPTDHPYINMFNQQKAVICVGKGDWEIPDTTKELKAILAEKGINIWVALWGYDVKHDWDWWYKQVVFFLPYVLER